jgi:hypothetical protein
MTNLSAAMKPIGEIPTEFLSPLANGLVTDVNTASSEHLLDHPQAPRKAEIEPHCITDHLRWEAMPTIEWITRLFHVST